MFEPKNEQGVVALFMMRIKAAGWELVEIGMPFPDAVLKRQGEIWRVEFEYVASNFIAHGHDYRECDLIICWVNDLRDCPLPVLALSEEGWERRSPVKGNPLASEVEYWKKRAMQLERELNKKLPKKIPTLSIQLNPRDAQMRLIELFRSDASMSNREAAKKLGVSHTTIQDLLNDLASKDVVHVEKVGRGKTVTVNGKLSAFLAGEI